MDMPPTRIISLLRAFATVALLAAFSVVPALADSTIYIYVDANGVQHFSNHPPAGDARWKAFIVHRERRPAPGSAAQAGAGAQRPRAAVADIATAPLPDSAPYREIIAKYSRIYGFDQLFVEAVIEIESAFDPAAVSAKGAQGLMQIMPETQRELGLSDPFDPEANIAAGLRYLRSLYERFGRVRLALAAYNAGPGAVAQYSGIPPFAETAAYVDAVLARYRQKKGA